jgi:hypothetical protein
MGHSMFSIAGRTVRLATGLRLELPETIEDALEISGVLVVRLTPSALLGGQNVLAIDVWGRTLWRAEPAASPYYGGQYAELMAERGYVRLVAADGHSTVVEPISGRVVRRFARVDLTPT